TVAGLIWSIPTPGAFAAVPLLNWTTIAMLLVFAFYLRLSPPLAIGMLAFMGAVIALLGWQARACSFPIWKSSLILFVLAWIGQFIGHKIEGKRPSFFRDVQFLLIGPAWLMHFIYRRLGIGY
ncbi:MAG TPA: Mpo1-like protein, partial [Candidatus Polarisedimenticolia bacterium]|nr:Mpo1-like protein [Candidatus Polarisedimenticolia bacterium]